MKEIKSVAATYSGVQFRSLLETSWAQFFDALGMPWEYEETAVEFGDGSKYLPDFYLPASNTWVEVKGKMNPEDQEKIIKLAAYAVERGEVVALVGSMAGVTFGSISEFWEYNLGATWARCRDCEQWSMSVARCRVCKKFSPNASDQFIADVCSGSGAKVSFTWGGSNPMMQPHEGKSVEWSRHGLDQLLTCGMKVINPGKRWG